MKKYFIIAFLILTVTCVAQDDKKGTIKVKKTDSTQRLMLINTPTVSTPLTIVEQMPVFPGGDKQMYAFIQQNIIYPEAEKKEGIQGTAYVTFVVDSIGSISDVKLLKGVSGGPGCDKEALRVVSMMPKWIAGKQNGRNGAVQCNLPINFKL